MQKLAPDNCHAGSNDFIASPQRQHQPLTASINGAPAKASFTERLR